MTREQDSNGSGNKPGGDFGMSPQEVIEAGTQAARLLQAPVYNLTYRLAVSEIIEAWSTTQVKEVNRRESLWAELQALGRAATLMSNLVDRAEQHLDEQRQRQPGNQNQQEAEYQGFGLDPDMMGGGDPHNFQ